MKKMECPFSFLNAIDGQKNGANPAGGTEPYFDN